MKKNQIEVADRLCKQWRKITDEALTLVTPDDLLAIDEMNQSDESVELANRILEIEATFSQVQLFLYSFEEFIKKNKPVK